MNSAKSKISKIKTISCLMLIIVSASFHIGCKKKNAPGPEEEDPAPTVEYYTLQRVENLATETTAENPAETNGTVLFSLFTKSKVSLDYVKATRWDISFGGLLSSFMGSNNGENSTNVAHGGTGRGGITIVEKAFDEVIDIPLNAQFKTSSNIVGTDNYGDFGEGIGWYLYDFEGTKVGDGTYDKQHIAYALSESLTLKSGQVVSPRTVIIKTAKGDFAKIKMISCYKDLFTTDSWSRTAPKMYLTFEYVIVPAGSTRFEIK